MLPRFDSGWDHHGLLALERWCAPGWAGGDLVPGRLLPKLGALRIDALSDAARGGLPGALPTGHPVCVV